MLRSPLLPLYLLAYAALVLAGLVELVWGWRKQKQPFGLRDTLANLGMYAGYVCISALWVPYVLVLYTWVHAVAPVRLTVGGFHAGTNGLWWEWLLLIVLEDLCFYIFHRCSHSLRFLWASHVNHHSSRRFNLSLGLRQTWTPFFAAFFWLPLILLGFDPLMVLTVQAGSLFYQAFLHSSLCPSLGVLGWIFNTPAHHRVHHAKNPAYLGKNLGGIFIVWDRLFGTFARSSEPIEYGLTRDIDSHNPLWIAAHEWWAMGSDLRRRGWRCLFWDYGEDEEG